MLVTVTLNPALDHHLHLPEIHLGTFNRAQSTLRMPGGKGVNVASSLAILGEEVVATGLLGGQGCLMFERHLRNIGVTTNFIYINQEIRTDFFLIEDKKDRQTLLVEKGGSIELRYLNSFKTNFERLLSAATLVEIGGSLPSGVPCSFIKELIDLANKKNVKVALNLPEAILEECLPKASLFIVHPDLRENKKMFGLDIFDAKARAKIIAELFKNNIEIIILKHGNLNYVVATREEVWDGEIDLGKEPILIGVRDAVLAGFMHKYLAENDLEAALKYGLAAGRSAAKNIMNYPTSKKEVEDFLPLAKARKVA